MDSVSRPRTVPPRKSLTRRLLVIVVVGLPRVLYGPTVPVAVLPGVEGRRGSSTGPHPASDPPAPGPTPPVGRPAGPAPTVDRRGVLHEVIPDRVPRDARVRTALCLHPTSVVLQSPSSFSGVGGPSRQGVLSVTQRSDRGCPDRCAGVKKG